MSLRESNNLFRDLLGSENHVELKAKHDAAVFIRDHIVKNGMTQTRIAELTNLSQPEVSKIVNFKLRDFSIDRLNAVLSAIDKTARIETAPVFRVGA